MNFLSAFELILIALTAIALTLHVSTRPGRMVLPLALVAGTFALAHVLSTIGDPRWEMMPVYVLAIVLAAIYGIHALRSRTRRRHPPASRQKRAAIRSCRAVVWGLRAVAMVIGLSLLTFPLLVAPMISDGYRHDFSRLGWTEAFDRMHAELAAEYPFTEWKGLDWPAQQAAFRPLIAASETSGDWAQYAGALRAYVYRIPDGHVRLVSPDDALRRQAVGGGFGLALGDLDEGRVIVTRLWAGKAASLAGMVWGAELIRWNGAPIAEALDQTPVLWAERPPATAQNRRIEQLRFLARAPVGTIAMVTFRNPGDGEVQTAELIADDDGEATLDATDPYPFGSLEKEPIETALLRDRYGYVKLRAQRFPSQMPATMRRAVEGFEEAGAAGIIIDLRGNRGGSDFTVAPLVEPFFSKPDLYHRVSFYHPLSGRFEPILFNAFDPVIPVISYRIAPRDRAYEGPVAVLIDQSTSSSAEGIAMLMARLPNVKLIGFYGTSGILGAGNTKRWLLPGGIQLRMLGGRSLDATGRIQVDSDAAGRGGVLPSLRIPRTEATLRAAFEGGRDLPLEQAMAWIDGVLPGA